MWPCRRDGNGILGSAAAPLACPENSFSVDEQSGHPVRCEIRALLFCFEMSKLLSEYSHDFLQCN